MHLPKSVLLNGAINKQLRSFLYFSIDLLINFLINDIIMGITTKSLQKYTLLHKHYSFLYV